MQVYFTVSLILSRITYIFIVQWFHQSTFLSVDIQVYHYCLDNVVPEFGVILQSCAKQIPIGFYVFNVNIILLWTYIQHRDIGRYDLLHCTTKRTTTNLKTKKQPELPENWILWKYNHQGVKEKTFIQTSCGMRGDKQSGLRGLAAMRQLVDQAVPHSHVDKLGRTTWWARQTMHSRDPVWEKKASQPLTVKICGGCDGRRNS